MAENPTNPPEPGAPFTAWIPIVLLAWILPGAGHFAQKKTIRGALISVSVIVVFLFGLMMRGPLFQPQASDLLTTIIYYGGFISHVASGIPYFLTVALGYNQPDVAGHVHDYGTKFLVAAGLLNVLAMVDAYEIKIGKKT